MVLACSDLNFNTVVLRNSFLCFVVALKTHLGNGFFSPTKVVLKVLVLSIAILLLKKVLVLLLPILFAQVFVLVLAILLVSIVNKPASRCS